MKPRFRRGQYGMWVVSSPVAYGMGYSITEAWRNYQRRLETQ